MLEDQISADTVYKALGGVDIRSPKHDKYTYKKLESFNKKYKGKEITKKYKGKRI